MWPTDRLSASPCRPAAAGVWEACRAGRPAATGRPDTDQSSLSDELELEFDDEFELEFDELFELELEELFELEFEELLEFEFEELFEFELDELLEFELELDPEGTQRPFSSVHQRPRN